MQRGFVPLAILALLLLVCFCSRTIALTIEPAIHVNIDSRPRPGAVR